VLGLPLLERLERDVVLCAEGYLFELERRGYLQSGPFVPEACSTTRTP
jgi:betaine-homocysteine S-methyltransferase